MKKIVRTAKTKTITTTTKSNFLTKTLVIVESPAKCKKIESYLGPGYKVVATFGHLRNITDLKSIAIDSDFSVTWSLNKEPIKQKQIELLRSEISAADEVVIATDSDREGEAIAWHICDLFNLDVSLVKRIVFNEITETAILAAIKAPTRINMDLVNAQKTRQIIDMLVGFIISPFLWKHISRSISGSSDTGTTGLSAGRCQTPALRLIYDNYKAIQESPGKKVYNTTGCFTNMNLIFDLNTVFTEPEQVQLFLNACKNSKFICNVSTPKKSLKKPPEPLTTSALQQLASNELHLSPKDTMKYAQQLYEGGYITYMRTDSKKYSNDFIEQVKVYIERMYDKTFISQNIASLINDSKETNSEKESNLAQEAHEAIRPVSISVVTLETNDTANNSKVDAKAVKLYNLIWKRSLESCMPSAQYNTITAKINLEPFYTDPVTKSCCEFSYKAEQVCFAGFHIVDLKPELLVKEYQYFTSLKPGTYVIPKKIDSKCVMHDLVAHFSESHLVKLLEDKGIGRPSTFASLIDKIQEREYVKKEDIKGKTVTVTDFSLLPNNKESEIKEIIMDKEFGNEKGKLVIQPIGIIVIEILIKFFDTFFNYEYTKTMESSLDAIANQSYNWRQVCINCNANLQSIVKSLAEEPKFSLYIDDDHEIIIGKFGPVIRKKTTTTTTKDSTNKKETIFIPLKKGIDINNLPPNFKLEDLMETETISEKGSNSYILGKYKGEDLYVKKGKYGLYVKWGQETRPLKELGNRPIENVNYIEVLRILDKDVLDADKPTGFVRELSATISIRTGKFGDYIFYKKPRAKNPQFLKLKGFDEDYKKCNKELILNWIKQTYGAE
jgi:DNA topoisomerase-1